MTFKEQVLEARHEVESAIDALEAMPRSYGGHRSADSTSTLDAPLDGEPVLHTDGRVMRLIRVLDERGTLCSYRGRWIVVPGYKLRALTS
jgi:hypothetical protein